MLLNHKLQCTDPNAQAAVPPGRSCFRRTAWRTVKKSDDALTKLSQKNMFTFLLLLTLSISSVLSQANLSSGMRLQRRSKRQCRKKLLSKQATSGSSSSISADGRPIYQSPNPDRAVAKPTVAALPAPKQSSEPAAAQTTVLSGDKQFSSDCLRLHNQYRSQEGVAPLVWDNQLASKAYSWANSLTSIKRLSHSNFGAGENLFHSYRGDKSCAAALGSWYSEKKYYRRGQKVDRVNYHKYGHFTQVNYPSKRLIS